MPFFSDIAEISCRDDSGTVRAHLVIKPLIRSGRVIRDELMIVDAENAAAEGVAPVQLRESCRYSYEIRPVNSGEVLTLEPNKMVDGYENQHLIETGNTAGHWTIRLKDSSNAVVAVGSAEIRSVKMDYLKEYRGMIKGISRMIPEYLFDLGAATDIPLVTEHSDDPPTLQQQVEFLRSILGSRDFRTAMGQVIRMPHDQLVQEPEVRTVLRPFKADGAFHSRIAMGGNRVHIPPAHPLFDRLKALGISNPSLPSTVSVKSRRRTLDTKENRFVKHVLRGFSAFLDHAEEVLAGCSQYRAVIEDISRLRSIVSGHLQAAMFNEVGEIRAIPLGSQVLQKRGGYREVLQHWLQFNLSSRVKWEGLEEVLGGGKSEFPAGKKDLPALYEAWLFLKIIELFREKFAVDESELRKLLSGENNLNFNLCYGRHVSFRGRPLRSGQTLNGELHYNRSFSGTTDPRSAGSWTRVLRPDFTMSFWTGDRSLPDAEKSQDAVHIHFDSKYKVHDIKRIFGDEVMTPDALEKEKRAQWDGNYNRGDLLKMHAYRDAIRRSGGAFVLYPGVVENPERDNRRWQTYRGFHELLPGLGAFAIKPDENGGAEGMVHLSQFLDRVMEQLSNRASMLSIYQANEWDIVETNDRWIREENEKEGVWDPLVEHLGLGGERPVSAHDIMVLIGWCKNHDHLTWIKEKGLYNFRIGAGVPGGIDQIEPRFAEAHMIVLHDASGALAGVWKVTRSGVQLFTRNDMAAKAYPDPSRDKYAVFGVEELPQYSKVYWNKEAVSIVRPELKNPARVGEPVVLSLAEFLRASPMTPEVPESYL